MDKLFRRNQKMKFNCSSQELTKQIHTVEKAISTRTTIPALENIYFELAEEELVLRGNNLEISIESRFPVSNGEAGATLLKSKMVSSIVSKLHQGDVSVETESDQKVVIKTDTVEFDLVSTSVSDYPVFPSVEDGIQVQLTVDNLLQLIKHTIFAVSFDETKPFLNGIWVKNDGDQLFFVATDGYRLSLKNMSIAMPESDFSVIVPFKALSELSKILQGVDSETVVTLNISSNQVAFKLPNLLFISRVIQGQFPDYKQVLPKEVENSFTVSRKAFLDACERASIIASAANNVVHLVFTDSGVTMLANAAGMGEFQETIDLERLSGTGEAKIAFNVRLILDSIKNLEMDSLKIEFNNELSPCVIKPVSDPDYTYILMPIRTAEYQPVPS